MHQNFEPKVPSEECWRRIRRQTAHQFLSKFHSNNLSDDNMSHEVEQMIIKLKVLTDQLNRSLCNS